MQQPPRPHGGENGPTVIDVHAHLVPPSLADKVAAHASSLPSVEARSEGGVLHLGLPRPGELGTARPVLPDLLDVEAAVARLDEQGVHLALVSIWPDLLGSTLPPEEAVVWTRCVNEALLEVSSAQECFRPLAAFPVQAPDPGQEMERIRDMGFAGIEIGTRADGQELDSPSLQGFWEAADQMAMPLFIHPMYMGGDPRLADGLRYGLANSIGRMNDTTVAVARLLLAGIPQRHPRATIVVAHGGGTIPFLVGRLRNVHEIHPDETHDPVEGFRRLCFDSLVFEPETLRYLLTMAGPEKVLLGSDYPFPNGDSKVRRLIESTLADEDELREVLGGNAERIFASYPTV